MNERPVTGYLVLTEEEAERFRDNGGGEGIPAEEIEPFLYRADGDEGRPAFLTRNDPVATMCCAASSTDPFAPPDEGGPSGGSTGGDPSSGDSDGAVTTLDLPRFIGRLLEGMTPPERPSEWRWPSRR